MSEPQKGVCRSCKADILWIVTAKNGKPHPVDPLPLVTIYDKEGVVRKGWTSHFASCPYAEKHRMKKPK